MLDLLIFGVIAIGIILTPIIHYLIYRVNQRRAKEAAKYEIWS